MINKKILVLHSSNDLYGASKILLNVLEVLIDQGNSIHLILPYKGPLDDLKSKGIIIKHQSLGVLRRKYFNFFGLINRLIKIFSSIFFINTYVKKNKIDLIYTNTSVIVPGAIVSKINKIPSFFHIHEIPTNSFYSNVIGIFIKLFGTKIIVVSDAVKKHWKRHVSPKKLYKIYNGIILTNKENDLKFKSPKIIFGIMARIIPYKGHEYFIDLANEIIKENNDVEFLIYGDTYPGYEKYLFNLKQKILDYGIDHKIIFKGFCDDVKNNFSEINFLIHCPIEPDPLPTVLLEAMNFKIPVIATRKGGIIEILDNGKGGLLIPHDDAKIASKNIIKFINDKSLIENKIIYSSKRLENNFSIDIFEKNIKTFFQ